MKETERGKRSDAKRRIQIKKKKTLKLNDTFIPQIARLIGLFWIEKISCHKKKYTMN